MTVAQQAAAFTQQIEIPRFASGVTCVYGLSGAGKSSLADTAAEYAAERFGVSTMCIASDPGGWGNRRLSLIRAGVMQVYDPRNHVNFFETTEALTKGAFPEKILDPDRGYADPNVRLLHPRQLVYIAKCPNGHEAARYHDQATMIASSARCPQCGILTTIANQTTEKITVRPGIFKNVGMRIFDSITSLNDQGLILELPRMSAQGELPTGRTGGSALGSADAVRQGDFVVGTGSEAQVGFMQNRSYGWLVNIRTIPDQVLGAICTFGVEESKDDARGGEISYGPAIAGKARTSRVPNWVGNCLHATKELDSANQMRYRLWLTNHVDMRDLAKRPYLAKHRGTPLGMPDFLEDPWHDDPRQREQLAWTKCSLKYFFTLLEQQYAEIAKADAAKFANFRQAPAEDEVIETATMATPVVVAPSLSVAGGMKPTMPPTMMPSVTAPSLTPTLTPSLAPSLTPTIVAAPTARVEQVPIQPQVNGVPPPAPAVLLTPTAPVATPSVPAPLAPMPMPLPMPTAGPLPPAAPIAASLPTATAPAMPGAVAPRPRRSARPPVN